MFSVYKFQRQGIKEKEMNQSKIKSGREKSSLSGENHEYTVRVVHVEASNERMCGMSLVYVFRFRAVKMYYYMNPERLRFKGMIKNRKGNMEWDVRENQRNEWCCR